MIALNGSPLGAGAAFAAVFAASLGNGGSYDDIAPGVEIFRGTREARQPEPRRRHRPRAARQRSGSDRHQLGLSLARLSRHGRRQGQSSTWSCRKAASPMAASTARRSRPTPPIRTPPSCGRNGCIRMRVSCCSSPATPIRRAMPISPRRTSIPASLSAKLPPAAPYARGQVRDAGPGGQGAEDPCRAVAADGEDLSFMPTD